MDRITLRPPTTWNRWFRAAAISRGPARSNRRCSLRMMSLLMAWFPWNVERHKCRPPTRMRPISSTNGRRGNSELDFVRYVFFKISSYSSRKWSLWAMRIQYMVAWFISFTVRGSTSRIKPFFDAWQSCMNRFTQAVTLVSIAKLENRSTGTSGSDTIAMYKQISSASMEGSFGGILDA